jgi:hypothetical protein
LIHNLCLSWVPLNGYINRFWPHKSPILNPCNDYLWGRWKRHSLLENSTFFMKTEKQYSKRNCQCVKIKLSHVSRKVVKMCKACLEAKSWQLKNLLRETELWRQDIYVVKLLWWLPCWGELSVEHKKANTHKLICMFVKVIINKHTRYVSRVYFIRS